MYLCVWGFLFYFISAHINRSNEDCDSIYIFVYLWINKNTPYCWHNSSSTTNTLLNGPTIIQEIENKEQVKSHSNQSLTLTDQDLDHRHHKNSLIRIVPILSNILRLNFQTKVCCPFTYILLVCLSTLFFQTGIQHQHQI